MQFFTYKGVNNSEVAEKLSLEMGYAVRAIFLEMGVIFKISAEHPCHFTSQVPPGHHTFLTCKNDFHVFLCRNQFCFSTILNVHKIKK